MRPFFIAVFGTELSCERQRVNKKPEDLSRVNQRGATQTSLRQPTYPGSSDNTELYLTTIMTYGSNYKRCSYKAFKWHVKKSQSLVNNYCYQTRQRVFISPVPGGSGRPQTTCSQLSWQMSAYITNQQDFDIKLLPSFRENGSREAGWQSGQG